MNINQKVASVLQQQYMIIESTSTSGDLYVCLDAQSDSHLEAESAFIRSRCIFNFGSSCRCEWSDGSEFLPLAPPHLLGKFACGNVIWHGNTLDVSGRLSVKHCSAEIILAQDSDRTSKAYRCLEYYKPWSKISTPCWYVALLLLICHINILHIHLANHTLPPSHHQHTKVLVLFALPCVGSLAKIKVPRFCQWWGPMRSL